MAFKKLIGNCAMLPFQIGGIGPLFLIAAVVIETLYITSNPVEIEKFNSGLQAIFAHYQFLSKFAENPDLPQRILYGIATIYLNSVLLYIFRLRKALILCILAIIVYTTIILFTLHLEKNCHQLILSNDFIKSIALIGGVYMMIP